MPTPTQRRIIHLISLAGGSATEAQIITLMGNSPNATNKHLCQMRRAGLICKVRGNVWLTMRGVDYDTCQNNSL